MLPRRRLLGGSLHEGIGLNFATGQYYVREQGRPANVQPLTSLFTFTGGNQSMYMGPGGLLVASATNTPRIEYDANGNCLGLLMEASRTNLCLQSQTLGTTWAPTRASVSSNVIAAPDGTTTADKIVEDSSAATTHLVLQGFTKAASALVYTVSAFFKSAERSEIRIMLHGTTSADSVSAIFNGSGSIVTAAAAAGTFTAASATITSFPNGWYRCTVTGTTDTATALNLRLDLSVAGSPSYNGDGTSGAYVWGVQLEQAAFASSYIPTTTVSVARTADSCIRTLGSEFSATAGTVVVAGRASGGQDSSNNQFVYEFSDDTANERDILFRPSAGDNARFNIIDGGVGQGPINDTFVNSTAFKHAAAFAANDMAVSFNGAAVQTDATVTLPTVTKLYLGSTTLSALQMNGHILRFDYYPTRLPNTYLVSASS